MTAKLLSPLTNEVAGTGISPLSAVGIALSKIVTENALARVPMIGNGTVKSGAWKLALALGVAGLGKAMNGQKVTSIISTGMLVDAGEDIVRGLIGNKLNGSSEENSVRELGGNTSNQGVVPQGAI